MARPSLAAAALLFLALIPRTATALDGRVGLHVLRLEPAGDVDDYTEASWGGGLDAALVIPGTGRLLAGDVGIEIVNFDRETLVFQPGPFAFRRELTTSQDYFRFYVGLELGPHGHGLLQPYVGVHGAVVSHSVSTTLTQPDDANPDNTLTQSTSETDTGVGYDVTGGLHLNLFNRFGLYGGVRYLQSFGLDQPLGDESVEVNPQYVGAFLGFSMDLGYIDSLNRGAGL